LRKNATHLILLVQNLQPHHNFSVQNSSLVGVNEASLICYLYHQEVRDENHISYNNSYTRHSFLL